MECTYGICRWYVISPRGASNTVKNTFQIQDDFVEGEEGTKSAQYNKSKVEIIGNNYLWQYRLENANFTGKKCIIIRWTRVNNIMFLQEQQTI